MKYILCAFLLVLVIVFLSPPMAHASSFNCHMQFPNEVACYDSGAHGIPGDTRVHTGFDLVIQIGNESFFQIFQGTIDGFAYEKYSTWVPTTLQSCLPRWVYVSDAYNSGWGNYFSPGVNYCVLTTTQSVSSNNL